MLNFLKIAVDIKYLFSKKVNTVTFSLIPTQFHLLIIKVPLFADIIIQKYLRRKAQ